MEAVVASEVKQRRWLTQIKDWGGGVDGKVNSVVSSHEKGEYDVKDD